MESPSFDLMHHGGDYAKTFPPPPITHALVSGGRPLAWSTSEAVARKTARVLWSVARFEPDGDSIRLLDVAGVELGRIVLAKGEWARPVRERFVRGRSR